MSHSPFKLQELRAQKLIDYCEKELEKTGITKNYKRNNVEKYVLTSLSFTTRLKIFLCNVFHFKYCRFISHKNIVVIDKHDLDPFIFFKIQKPDSTFSCTLEEALKFMDQKSRKKVLFNLDLFQKCSDPGFLAYQYNKPSGVRTTLV